MGKNERDRRSFQFTHERGSFLAHIFSIFKFMNVSERGSLFCSVHVHFKFISSSQKCATLPTLTKLYTKIFLKTSVCLGKSGGHTIY